MIPKSNPAAKPVAELSAAEWKDTFFKTHPNADANGDGTLSWPEYKVYKAKLDAGEVGKPKGNPKAPAAPGRLQASGTFSKTADGGLIFTDQTDGKVYYVIKELAGAVESQLDKPVKIVANVKDSTKSKAKVMVYLVSIQAAETGKPQPKTEPKAPVAVAGRLQTNGTFSKTAEGGIIFTDQSGGQVYYVIKELAASVEPHLDKPVKIVARVKDSTSSKAKVMVHLVSIQLAR